MASPTTEKAAMMTLQSLYPVVPVSFFTIGAMTVMSVFGTVVYLELPKNQRTRGQFIFNICSWAILVLFSLSEVADAYEVFTILVEGTSPFDSLRLKVIYEFSWWRIATSVCIWIVPWIGDGLLLYRCYMTWHDCIWVCILPVVTYLASCAMSIVTIYRRIIAMYNPSVSPTAYAKALSAWLYLSVSLNVLITILISFRLLRVRRQMSALLSPEDLQIYYGIIAILVESALPLSFGGLAFALLSVAQANGGWIVARTVALMMWFCLSALCPQLIIFRVAVGRSWLARPTPDAPHQISRLAFNPMTESKPGEDVEQIGQSESASASESVDPALPTRFHEKDH